MSTEPRPTHDPTEALAEDVMTPQEVAEYAVWYARKVKGPRAKVAAALLEEFPWLREPLERAGWHEELRPALRRLVESATTLETVDDDGEVAEFWVVPPGPLEHARAALDSDR